MRILGALVFVAGIFLFFGNVSGTFPTFPGLGYLTILAGAALFKAGS